MLTISLSGVTEKKSKVNVKLKAPNGGASLIQSNRFGGNCLAAGSVLATVISFESRAKLQMTVLGTHS